MTRTDVARGITSITDRTGVQIGLVLALAVAVFSAGRWTNNIEASTRIQRIEGERQLSDALATITEQVAAIQRQMSRSQEMQEAFAQRFDAFLASGDRWPLQQMVDWVVAAAAQGIDLPDPEDRMYRPMSATRPHLFERGPAPPQAR